MHCVSTAGRHSKGEQHLGWHSTRKDRSTGLFSVDMIHPEFLNQPFKRKMNGLSATLDNIFGIKELNEKEGAFDQKSATMRNFLP